MRGLAYKRFQRENHIKRKENFLRKCRTDNPPHKYNDSDLFAFVIFPRGKEVAYEGYWLPYWIVANRGKLNKGKIHCSCPLCRAKTRNKGKKRHGNYAPSFNYKHSDKIKIQNMEDEIKEFNNFYFGKLSNVEEDFNDCKRIGSKTSL